MKELLEIALAVVAAALITAFVIYYILYLKPNSDYKKNLSKLKIQSAGAKINQQKDCIHFLKTGSSDAILIESQEHYALVDCAEDSDNPRNFPALEFKGYEQEVLDYLKKNCAADDGKVYIDFVLGTHAHSDHIGGFDTVIADDDIVISRAYLKKYDESKINSYEVEKWDNKEVYEQMLNALNSKGIPVIADITETEFKLGEFNIKLYNTEYDTVNDITGENDNSIGVLVEKGGKKAFLAADIDNKTGDEDRLGPQIGKVDILKVGHHSYSGSTTAKWLKTLMPEVCVVTNDYERTDRQTLRRITRITHAPILDTGTNNGVLCVFENDGTISYCSDICE